MSNEKKKGHEDMKPDAKGRRKFLKKTALGGHRRCHPLAQPSPSTPEEADARASWAEYFQKNYRLMTEKEKKEAIERLEKRYSEEYKNEQVTVDDSPAMEGVLFGMALNIQKCIGCRRCV